MLLVEDCHARLDYGRRRTRRRKEDKSVMHCSDLSQLYIKLACINRELNLLPGPSVSHPSHQIDQRDQHRYLDKRPNSSSKCLIAIGTIRSYSNSNSKLEVVTRSCKALGGSQLVSIPKLVTYPQREKEDDDEVHNEWCCDSDNRDNLVNDLATLRGEENEDGVEKADE